MSQEYEPQSLERDLQHHWLQNNRYAVQVDDQREKFYCLAMFPYPSLFLFVLRAPDDVLCVRPGGGGSAPRPLIRRSAGLGAGQGVLLPGRDGGDVVGSADGVRRGKLTISYPVRLWDRDDECSGRRRGKVAARPRARLT